MDGLEPCGLSSNRVGVLEAGGPHSWHMCRIALSGVNPSGCIPRVGHATTPWRLAAYHVNEKEAVAQRDNRRGSGRRESTVGWRRATDLFVAAASSAAIDLNVSTGWWESIALDNSGDALTMAGMLDGGRCGPSSSSSWQLPRASTE
jgi:hypothetical protein